MTKREAAIVSAYTGILCGDFAAFHAYVEEILGRSVWTHEMGDQAVFAEIKAAAKPDFIALCVQPEGQEGSK